MERSFYLIQFEFSENVVAAKKKKVPLTLLLMTCLPTR